MMIVHNEGGKAAVLDFKARARFATAEGRRKKLVYINCVQGTFLCVYN